MMKGIVKVFSSDRYTKAFYLENLKMLSEVFTYARKSGMAKLETDVEEPAKSPVFSKYKNFLKDHHAVFFICDTLRMSISGGVGHFDLDQMMEQDMEVHHREVAASVNAMSLNAISLMVCGHVGAVRRVVER